MWIAVAVIGVLGLLAVVVLFSDRKGDREFRASSSYVRKRFPKF